MTPTDILAVVTPLLRSAGYYVRSAATSGNYVTSSKADPYDLVTEIDTEMERRILGALDAHWPQYGVLAEEGSNRNPEADRVWVLDPIDGTRNFTRNHAGYCISLGLLEHGEPVLGVVLDIATDDLYTATRGGGAWLNGERISVTRDVSLAGSLIGVGTTPALRQDPDGPRRYMNLMHGVSGLRQSGAVARDLAYVARGSLDGFWQGDVKPWDIAAGMLLVQEAGGEVHLDLDGGTWLDSTRLGVVAAGTGLMAELTELLD